MTASHPASQNEILRVMASTKSYTGLAVLVFFLYGLFFVPGLIVNVMLYLEARQNEAIAGHTLPGVGCLFVQLMLAILVLLLVLGCAGLVLVGVPVLSTLGSLSGSGS